MRMCWVRAMKYGVAFFPRSMKAGSRRRQKMIIECVSPRCCRPGINRSASEIMETTNSRGMFTLTFRTLDVVLPDKYPKARCPTAYVGGSSNCLGRFNVFALFMLCSCGKYVEFIKSISEYKIEYV